ncbi:hypothetical protein D3C71_1512000 [compost metagenome]
MPQRVFSRVYALKEGQQVGLRLSAPMMKIVVLGCIAIKDVVEKDVVRIGIFEICSDKAFDLAVVVLHEVLSLENGLGTSAGFE